jgi:hypothetical protein
MSDSSATQASRRSGLQLAGALVAALIVLAVFGVPADEDVGQGGASSYSAEQAGLRGFYESARRLGWDTRRLEEPLRGPLDSAAVYVIIEPIVSLTSSEASAVLTAVRQGAGLLLSDASGAPLLDSLGLQRATVRNGRLSLADTGRFQAGRAGLPFGLRNSTLRAKRPLPPDTVVFAREIVPAEDRASSVSVLGIPLGAGRVGVFADGQRLRNVGFRDDGAAEVSIRALEWVTHNRRAPLVFTEYQQGFGRHPTLSATVSDVLSGTTAGRVALQGALAALVLLLAVAIRPMPPRATFRVERRSALEHVEALAGAFEHSGATRWATRRLVRGVRRRHPAGASRAMPDDAYLSWVAARFPPTVADVRAVGHALSEPVSPVGFREVGDAISHIERTVTR